MPRVPIFHPQARAGPPPIVVPVLMVLIVAKNPGQVSLLPVLAGFTTNYLATLAQIVYPDNFGVTGTEEKSDSK